MGRLLAPILLGGLFVVFGVQHLYSGFKLQLLGVPTSATKFEYVVECAVESEVGSQGRTRTPMSCDEATAFVKSAASKKVKFEIERYDRVRYTLQSGQTHEAKVKTSNLNAGEAKTGEPFAAFYDPANPDDIRAEMSLKQVEGDLFILSFGLAGLILAYLAWKLKQRSEREPATLDPADFASLASHSTAVGGDYGRAPRGFGRR